MNDKLTPHKWSRVAQLCLRALCSLCTNDAEEHRSRIQKACGIIGIIQDSDESTDVMSDDTLTAYRKCVRPESGKHFSDFTDEEIKQLGADVSEFLSSCLMDVGMAKAGLIPRDINQFDSDRPVRLKSTR